jgi:hypothetical protein
VNTIKQRSGDSLILTLPIRTRNPLNGSQAGWRAKARVRKEQRTVTALALRPHLDGVKLPVRILVTRIAPRQLDAWDGLGAALKGCIDGIADAFGVRDDDERITWAVDQTRGTAGYYGVSIAITATGRGQGGVLGDGTSSGPSGGKRSAPGTIGGSDDSSIG